MHGCRYTHSWAFSTFVNITLGLKWKWQQRGLPSVCTAGSADKREGVQCQQRVFVEKVSSTGWHWQLELLSLEFSSSSLFSHAFLVDCHD